MGAFRANKWVSPAPACQATLTDHQREPLACPDRKGQRTTFRIAAPPKGGGQSLV
jgi:hypothetical protein